MEVEDRQRARQQFLATNGWGSSEVTALAADASFRRYFRLQQDGESRLLMDAPPPREDIVPFVKVANHLHKIGLRAPNIHAHDLQQGFALLEDFGDDTFTRLLAQGEDESALYEMALEVLLLLHKNEKACDIDLPAYDDKVLMREAMLLPEWYYPMLKGQPCPEQGLQAYQSAWQNCFKPLHSAEPALVLRDFHVDNLMRLGTGEGVERCGILDFQDALIGSAAYDLMSLLEDARRDVSDQLQQKLLQRYLNSREHLGKKHFMKCYRVLAAQRHAKVAGIFVRLCERDGKSHYLSHIPRVIRLLQSNLQAEELTPVKDWFEQWLPELGDPLQGADK